MTVATVCHIELPKTSHRDALVIKRVQNVHIESSWKNLTDTAKVVLPRIAPQWKNQKLKDYIRRGDAIKIQLGYNNMLEDEFSGYVTEVKDTGSIEIHCEDEMYMLKKGKVSVSYRNATLPQLLKDIAPGYKIDALPLELGAVRYSLTPALILKDLKDQAKINCFFRKGVLVGGKIHSDDHKRIVIDYERKVRAQNLEFKNNQDALIKITAESTLLDGSRITVSVGDDGGQENKLSYFNVTNKAKLKENAEQDLIKLKRDGFEGTIDLFGRPLVYHGDVVGLESIRYPERDGDYFVDGITIDFGPSEGYKRTIELGGLAA